MDINIIRRLNQLNKAFYAQTAESFSQSRDHAWEGWLKLLPYLKTPLAVLDVGCGNGRFGIFLHEQLGDGIQYHGMDNAPALLEFAQQAFDEHGLAFTLENRDMVENPSDAGEYDLVAVFGVLHHIPGYENRQGFVRRLGERVKNGGYLTFTSWRFYEQPRFRERIVAWPDDFEVEAHDYLLDWRRDRDMEKKTALRYCHYIDDVEHQSLITAAGLTEIVTYRADGRSGDLNCYSLLRRG
ncbi:MAG: class I SAM-dependent methyltransferase [Chloroflexi bacterium]|nr:class I SAM-dependent methyltransferase [Chloroflexota bacterium]